MIKQVDISAEELLQASVRILLRPVIEIVYRDPHRWSERPCQSCRTITAILGEPFGCEKFQLERNL